MNILPPESLTIDGQRFRVHNGQVAALFYTDERHFLPGRDYVFEPGEESDWITAVFPAAFTLERPLCLAIATAPGMVQHFQALFTDDTRRRVLVPIELQALLEPIPLAHDHGPSN